MQNPLLYFSLLDAYAMPNCAHLITCIFVSCTPYMTLFCFGRYATLKMWGHTCGNVIFHLTQIFFFLI